MSSFYYNVIILLQSYCNLIEFLYNRYPFFDTPCIYISPNYFLNYTYKLHFLHVFLITVTNR